MADRQRIGILRSAFDPVQKAHVQLGLDLLDSCRLDRILFVPTADDQSQTVCAGTEDRWKLLVAACSCDDRLSPCRCELDSAGRISIRDSLRTVRHRFPGSSVFYISDAETLLKADFGDEFPSWCSFIVCFGTGCSDTALMDRAADLLSSSGRHLIPFQSGSLPVPSENLHTLFSEGLIPSVLTEPVQEYCVCKGLYGLPGRLNQIDCWMDLLFSSLKPKRFAHSLSVADTAKKLAAIHGIDPLKAEQAGLLHDCAKCFPLDKMQKIAMDNSLTDDPAILSSGALLHSIAGAQTASDLYGMTDPEILDAIRYHNTGFPGMSRLAMCVCLADSIEPLRTGYPYLEEIRSMSLISLERSLLLSLERTADYVHQRGRYLHPRTRDTILWLRDLISGQDQAQA